MTPTRKPVAQALSAATPEADLISAALRGDGAGFEILMRRHNRLVFRTARSILTSDAEAEEVAQDAWLKAWRGLPGFRAEARFPTWIVRITRNEALGRLRRVAAQVIPLEAAMTASDPETRAALTEDADRTPEAELDRAQTRRLMEDRIDRLPEVYRTVFMLRAVEEMSVEEVALALDIPPATVRTRFFRARSLLREGLAGAMDAAITEVHAFDGARCDRIVVKVLAAAVAQGLCDPK